MTIAREDGYEYRWLRDAEQTAGVNTGWLRRVLDRLELGEDRFGDAWLDRRIEELLRETREEAEDLGAWGVLAAQRIRVLVEIDPSDRAQILGWLRESAACAARADELLRRCLLRLPDGL